jgi:hypothetical protein
MEIVALTRCVFLHLVAKMTDWFLEQQINTKFYVKLKNNASITCAKLSKAYRGEAMKKSKVLNGIKGSHVKITNEGNAKHFL